MLPDSAFYFITGYVTFSMRSDFKRNAYLWFMVVIFVCEIAFFVTLFLDYNTDKAARQSTVQEKLFLQTTKNMAHNCSLHM